MNKENFELLVAYLLIILFLIVIVLISRYLNIHFKHEIGTLFLLFSITIVACFKLLHTPYIYLMKIFNKFIKFKD